ncbi:hypothetical protein AAGS40_21235 [Paraburkholderia sp. PREW-6R]|uniref:hypothetical protein n=1 Tax=Paraburkholderia sp. PREW-6R TaxID=3141544 RepID=UPI0031F4A522
MLTVLISEITLSEYLTAHEQGWTAHFGRSALVARGRLRVLPCIAPVFASVICLLACGRLSGTTGLPLLNQSRNV